MSDSQRPAFEDHKIRSMTGFGRGQASHAEVDIIVELRSVNNRHLSTKIRLPGSVSRFERTVDEKVRAVLSRGSVDVFVKIKGTPPEARAKIDVQALEHYYQALQGFADSRDLKISVELGRLLSLPGALVEPDSSAIDQALGDAVLAALDQALSELILMRQSEGRRLCHELAKRLKTIGEVVAEIEARAPAVVSEHHEKLRERVEKLMEGERLSLDDEGLRREVAFLADKLDVTEELERLRAHIAHFEELLAGSSPVGRKLDFLLQEFGREANTIGSKASDEKMARWVVELKSEFEKIREQVQNLE